MAGQTNLRAEEEAVRAGTAAIETYLENYQQRQLLRFVCVGSVDDGKSTLIGRLLHDTGTIYADQMEAVAQASAKKGSELDLALLTDGLQAEREQGITIDVAYRHFTTDKRKFIIADTPGHVQYTRNMVTGASTADLALILIDARLGVLAQSRRHAHIASLLGIKNLAVCINKMDLVGHDQTRFQDIESEFRAFASPLGFADVGCIPISALEGTNVVRPDTEHTPWYRGPTVLQYLESVPIHHDSDKENQQSPGTNHFRFPVQYVLRPNLDFRGFAGWIARGSVQPGDRVLALPSGKSSTIRDIHLYNTTLDQGVEGQSVVLRTDDEIDISRGDILVSPDHLPQVQRQVTADLVWLDEAPLLQDKTYLLKHTTRTLHAQVSAIQWKRDTESFEPIQADTLGMNDIARVDLSCHRALLFDDYSDQRQTGAFILIDSLSRNTVAAGMLRAPNATPPTLEHAMEEVHARSGLGHQTHIGQEERNQRSKQLGMSVKGGVIWLSGLPGSGRWDLAYALERALFDRGHWTTVLDPENETTDSTLSAARACARAGVLAITAFQTPSWDREQWQRARDRLGHLSTLIVHVNTSEERARQRRPSGGPPATPPPAPDITVSLDDAELDAAVDIILEQVEKWSDPT